MLGELKVGTKDLQSEQLMKRHYGLLTIMGNDTEKRRELATTTLSGREVVLLVAKRRCEAAKADSGKERGKHQQEQRPSKSKLAVR